MNRKWTGSGPKVDPVELSRAILRSDKPLSGGFWERQGASFLDKKSRVTFFGFDDVIPDRFFLFHDDLKLPNYTIG